MATCPLCERPDTQERFVENGYTVLRCAQCGLFFIDPYPVAPSVRHKVVEDYSFDDIAILNTKRHYAAEVEYYREHFPSLVRFCSGVRNLLDVGCGTGRLMELLHSTGVACEGVELNSERAALARVKSGCLVHQVPVEELHTGKQYDTITMINVLSHIPSIPLLFEAVDRLLSRDGRLILVTSELRDDVQRDDVIRWDIPDHMHFLGYDTLGYICRRFGYTILEHTQKPYSSCVFSKARFRAPGRSRVRNLTKRIILLMPLALRFLRWRYDMTHGGRMQISLVVLGRSDVPR